MIGSLYSLDNTLGTTLDLHTILKFTRKDVESSRTRLEDMKKIKIERGRDGDGFGRERGK